jgi:formylglycine-generating enzyme required for sulfatase activity
MAALAAALLAGAARAPAAGSGGGEGGASPARPAAARGAGAAAAATGMASVPAGSYVPLYRGPRLPDGRASAPRRVAVAAFHMDVRPVTNAQYLEFVRAHPEWRRSRVKRIFADESYLRHWRGDLELGPGAPPESPVVHVSWFAARAYCRAVGKRLPRVDEWEYVAAASEDHREATRDPAFQERLRAWYSRPTPEPLPPIGSTFRNAYGIDDLHGLVWEWTLDFDSALVTGESRADAALEGSLYCGSGAANAADFENYAAFMRYAFRSSLEARYCIANLGFRGVKAAGPEPGAAP